MIKNMRHVGLVVKDLDAALHFYQNILGFKIARQMEESGDYLDSVLGRKNSSITTVKLASPDGQQLELITYHSSFSETPARALNETGLTHLAFTVSDIDDVYSKLKGEGIVFNSPPCLSPDGMAKVAFCRSPEGTYIELVEIQ